MKKTKILLMFVVMLVSIMLYTQPAQALPTGLYISVPTSPDPLVSQGDFFHVGVYAAVPTVPYPAGVNSFSFTMWSDPGLIYNGAVLGPGFTEDPNALPNQVIGSSTIPLQHEYWQGTIMACLATLSFQAPQEGVFNLGIEGFAWAQDYDGGEVLSVMSPISVWTNVWVDPNPYQQDPSVPEPTTMLLFGSGLLGLVGYRKKS